MDIKPLLKEMLDKKASDLHLRAGGPAVIRVDGKLVPLSQSLTPQETITVALSLMSVEQKQIFHDRRRGRPLVHVRRARPLQDKCFQPAGPREPRDARRPGQDTRDTGTETAPGHLADSR